MNHELLRTVIFSPIVIPISHTNDKNALVISPSLSQTIFFYFFPSASPQSTTAPVGTSSHDILTPTWRVLNNEDMESLDQQESIVEDISDESYIRRHIRCELEQETWLTNSTLSLNSNRKSGTLQTSISLPNSLSTTTNCQTNRLTPNGMAYS